MTAVVAKYRQVFLVGLQSNLIYRWNFLARGLFSLLRLGVSVILWSAAYAGVAKIGGFGLDQTLTYFVTLILLQFFIGAFNEDYQISEDIRNGLINQFLTKPINYFLYRFSVFAAARMVSGALIVIPVVLFLPVLRGWLTFPHEPWRIACAIPALTMAALIQFTIAYCFGLLTFWLLEIQGFVILSMAVETVLGGQVFPLDLMPPAIFHASRFLPFFYQMYFPAAILTGRVAFPMVVQGLGLQLAWVVVLLLIAEFLWRRCLRRHTAVGG